MAKIRSHLVAIMVLFCSALGGLAEAAEPWPMKMRYQESELKDRELVTRRFDQVVLKEGFTLLNPRPGKEIPFLFLDQVAYHPYSRGFVLLKTDVEPSDDRFFGRLLLHSKGFIAHVRTSQGSIALFFMGVPEPDSNRILGRLTARMNSHPSSSAYIRIIVPLVVSEAKAETSCPSASRVGQDWLTGNLSLLPVIEQSARTSSTLGCFWNGLRQALDFSSSGEEEGPGILERSREALRSAYNSPGALWNGLTTQVSNIETFVRQLPEQVAQLGPSIANLSIEARQEIYCQIVSDLAPDVALSALGGVGVARFAVGLRAWIARFERLNSLLSWIQNSRLAASAASLQTSIIRNYRRLSDKAVEAISDLSRLNLNDLALRMATCGSN